ncbi:MAG: hypothetical protein WCH99_00570 [Verrucomicrobiota bacterium]
MYNVLKLHLVWWLGLVPACCRTATALALPDWLQLMFSVRRAWSFFDIWILSRRPF